MRKVNYENFSHIGDACTYQDQSNSGHISLKQLRNIAKSDSLPIKDHLLQELLNHLNTDAEGNVDYKQFIDFLNWRDKPGEKFLGTFLQIGIWHFLSPFSVNNCCDSGLCSKNISVYP